MYKLKLVSLTALFFISVSSQASWGLWQDYIILDSGSGNMYHAGSANADLATSFINNYYGNFASAGTFTLVGGEIKTFKNGSSNVCGGTLYYRTYRTCDTPGSFNAVVLSFDSDLGGGDQKWDNTSANINLLGGLDRSGTYVIEVYWEAEGNTTNPGGCGEFVYDSNSGNNWRGYFDYEMTDSFTDNNHSASPVWSGDTGSWTVVANSDASSLTGTEILQTRTLRLSHASGGGTQHIRTPVSTWDNQQQWSWWMGRRAQAATSTNQAQFWLYGNESNLESGTVDGYRVVFGDDTGNDEVIIQSVTNGVGTPILTSTTAVLNNITDYGFTVLVTRDISGVWTLSTSALPVANGGGATVNVCPITSSTVNHGSVTNTLYTPGGAGFIGVVGLHSGSANARAGLEVDNIKFRATHVYLATGSAIVNEDDGTYSVMVNIANPSSQVATTVTLVHTTGDAGRVNGFVSQLVTFPAGSSAAQSVVLTLTDNPDCDDVAELSFELQSAAGGTDAYIGEPYTLSLTVVDDDMGYETWLTDDFEDNNTTGWTSTPPAYWESSNFVPCSGTYSARSADVNVASQSSFTYDVDSKCLDGVLTTWQFNLRYSNEPSPNNKFLAFISANESNLWSGTVDGYAVGVNPIISGDPDIITLWQVDNGVPTTPIVTTTIDWGGGMSEVGFYITRSEDGTWELMVDSNGDFDNLVSYGTGTNTTYRNVPHFGVRYIWTVSFDRDLALDDVSITSKGCRSIYYSQSSGNLSDPIWDTQPVGVGGVIFPGRYTRLVVQNGHTVAQDDNLTSDDITIESTAVLNAGSFRHKVYGNWINDGTHNAGTGEVVFRGDENQLVAGTTSGTFNNLTVDNDGFTVTLATATNVNGLVSPEEGTLNANGNLTLLSTSATHAASIGEIKSGADVIGNLTLQRHVPSWTYNGIGQNQGGTWINLASSLNGSMTLADWNDDMITTGFLGSDYPPPYPFVNIASYDESVPGNRNMGYVNASDITNALSGGYFAFLPYNSHTVDVTGTINKGSQLQAVNYTNSGDVGDGYNLLYNIYPSEVDFDQLVQNGFGATFYYVYDRDLPGYRSYNGITQVGTGSRYIAHSQSFFTYSNPAAGGLQYEESFKTNTGSAFVRSREESSLISLRIEHGGMADEAVIAFVAGTSAQFEYEYDAPKMENDFVPEAPELALVSSDGTNLTIQSLEHSAAVAIPVWIEAPQSGDYVLVVNEIKNLPAGACMVIEDLVTGEAVVVDNGSAINFSVTEPSSAVRFVIHSTTAVDVITTDATCNGENGELQLTTDGGNWNYIISNEQNEVVLNAMNNTLTAQLPAGVYTVEMNNTMDQCNANSLIVEIREPIAQTISIESLIAKCDLSVGSIEFAVGNVGSYNYTIIGYDGAVFATGTSSDMAMRFENLDADVYTVNVNTSCNVLTEAVDLRDVNSVVAQIDSPVEIMVGQPIEFISQTSNATDAVWILDHNTIADGEVFTHTFYETGEHHLLMFGYNDICFDDATLDFAVKEAVSVSENNSGTLIQLLNHANAIELQFNNNTSGDFEIEIFNNLGQVVISQIVFANCFIETTTLARGAYTIQVSQQDDVVFSQKFVK